MIFTVLINPWIYILWTLLIPPILFRCGPLTPFMHLMKMIKEKELSFISYITTVFFIMAQYILLFACLNMVFSTIENNQHQEITSLWDNIYFSIVTFTTLGYGNLVPTNTAGEI